MSRPSDTAAHASSTAASTVDSHLESSLASTTSTLATLTMSPESTPESTVSDLPDHLSASSTSRKFAPSLATGATPRVRDIELKDIPVLPVPPIPRLITEDWHHKVFGKWTSTSNYPDDNVLECTRDITWNHCVSVLLPIDNQDRFSDLYEFFTRNDVKALLCRRAGLTDLLPDRTLAGSASLQAGLIEAFVTGLEYSQDVHIAAAWVEMLCYPYILYFVAQVITRQEGPRPPTYRAKYCEVRHAADGTLRVHKLSGANQ